jgi:thymidylate synthase (FAD)
MKIAQIAVELIDSMGDDLRVVNAARVSHDKESKWENVPFEMADPRPDGTFPTRLSDKDAKLIKYLVEHNHWTPFAHCFASFCIKAPIFVARQLVKHQVGLAWNEVSRRYVDTEPEFWFPKVWRERPESNIKQGSGGAMPEQELWGQSAHEHCENLLAWYRHAIKCGVAPEQARMILPLTTMTQWYWSGSLAAFARVCNLRLDPHAQEEAREVADHIDKHMRGIFPVSWRELVK